MAVTAEESGERLVRELWELFEARATFRVASFFEVRDGRIAFAREYWVEEGLESHPERARWTEPLA